MRTFLITLLLQAMVMGGLYAQTKQDSSTSTQNKSPLQVEEGHRIAQFSILPGLSTQAGNMDATNHLSFNLFWGLNGGLRGLEIGGLGNSIKQDMLGFQMAGLANTVGGDGMGLQAAGIMNFTAGHFRGIQSAGIFNYTKSIDGIQAGGIFNYANEVNGLQAGLVNQAKKVKGVQFGFVNIADSLQGIPVGFINIVKKNGYNKLELASTETMHAVLGLKFGAKALYSMVELGYRREKQLDSHTLSIGYGMGSYLPINKFMGLNFELVCTYIDGVYIPNVGYYNPDGFYFSNQYNLINQARLTYDFAPIKGVSIFVGPTFNLLIAKDLADAGEFPMWPGVRAGVRLF